MSEEGSGGRPVRANVHLQQYSSAKNVETGSLRNENFESGTFRNENFARFRFVLFRFRSRRQAFSHSCENTRGPIYRCTARQPGADNLLLLFRLTRDSCAHLSPRLLLHNNITPEVHRPVVYLGNMVGRKSDTRERRIFCIFFLFFFFARKTPFS